MTLDLANRDLRDRAFTDQNLSGADFRGSDLRGCDFTGAILRGANFTGAKFGKSRRRVWSLITKAGAIAIAVTLAAALGGLTIGSVGSASAVVATASVAIAVTRGETGIIAGAIAGTAAVIGAGGIIAFLGGDVSRGLLLFLGSGVILAFAAFLFIQTVTELEQLSRTSFQNADLTSAIFDQVILKEANLEGAIGLNFYQKNPA
jgi:uncharacterized protein YjbI with pentapeptide repeats